MQTMTINGFRVNENEDLFFPENNNTKQHLNETSYILNSTLG